jgi:hypothetical protein
VEITTWNIGRLIRAMEITVEMNAETELFELWCSDKRMCPMPAGPRLFRANPPEIKFEHADYGPAAADARKLQTYLEGLAPAKRMTKKQIAEAFE